MCYYIQAFIKIEKLCVLRRIFNFMVKKLTTWLVLLTLAIGTVSMLSGCGSSAATVDINTGISDEEVSVYDIEGEGVAGSVEVKDVTQYAYNNLTGEYTLASDMVGKRPIAVSINNINLSWPEYGTSLPDILFEMETEGGIPRYMGLFSDLRGIQQIGSFRSLRDQFIELVYPYDALICHIGTSVFADEVLAKIGLRTLDGYYYSDLFFTDPARVSAGYAIEHTKFVSAQSIYAAIEKYGYSLNADYSSKAFNFVEPGETVVPTSGEANHITFNFSASYDGDLRYDAESGKYLKWEKGTQQVDASNSQPLAFTNAVLVIADIEMRGNTGLIEVDFSTGGTAYYFSQGHYTLCNWTKGTGDYASNFTFTDAATGEEIKVNTGNTYFAVIRKTLADTVAIS